MKVFLLIIILGFTVIFKTDQTSSSLQGLWKEQSEVESYLYIKNKRWLSLVVFNGEIIKTENSFGFINNIEIDSLSVSEIKETGKFLVVYSSKLSKLKDKRFSFRRKFKVYEYDVSPNSFIYYGNQPIKYSRIDSLPYHFEKRNLIEYFDN